MTTPIELQTERLHLRPWRADDVEPFTAMNADPRVMEFFPSTHSRDASAAAVTRWQARIDERGWGLWAAELRRSGEFIGFVGLEVPTERLGMTESEGTFEHPAVAPGSPVREHCLYRLTMAPEAVKTARLDADSTPARDDRTTSCRR